MNQMNLIKLFYKTHENILKEILLVRSHRIFKNILKRVVKTEAKFIKQTPHSFLMNQMIQ